MRQFANDTPEQQSRSITVDRIEKETDKAICVLDGYGAKLWLPKIDEKLDIEVPGWFWEKENLAARFGE